MRSKTAAAELNKARSCAWARRFAAAGLLVIALLATACPSGQSKAEAVFKQMIEAVQNVQSVHAEMDLDIEVVADGEQGTVNTDASIDFQQPDRVRLTLGVSGISGISTARWLPMELGVVVIGPTLYVKPPMSDEWAESDFPGSLFATGQPSDAQMPEWTIGDMDPLARIGELDPTEFGEFTLLQRETVDGALTDHLRFKTDEQGLFGFLDFMLASEGVPPMDAPDMPEGLHATLQFDVWIGVDDHLPRREIITGEFTVDGDSPGEDPTVAIDATVTFSRYGEDMHIQPPETVSPSSP